MISKSLKVISFTYTNSTFYAQYHPNFPLPNQASRMKNSFAGSGGTALEVFADPIGDIRIDYNGALTIFSEPQNNRYLVEHCYGVDSTIINYPSAVDEFRTQLKHFKEINNSIVCLPGGGYNLHHFVFEILPSLLLFREEVKSADTLVLGATTGATFLAEFNDIFSLNQRLTLIPPSSTLKITNSTNISAVPFRIYPLEQINQIRTEVNKALTSSSLNQSETVFIGRKDMDRNRRLLTNEKQVIDTLSKSIGEIQIIRPGVSKLSKTVQDIKHARILIGSTGGNLAHLIWAINLEIFIEIVPYGYHGDTETEELSKIMNFKYFRVGSESLPDMAWNYSDQQCNLDELNRLLTDNF
jgi:hypothetical protein